MTNLLFSILPILSTNSLIISIDGENKTAIIVSKNFFLLIKLALMSFWDSFSIFISLNNSSSETLSGSLFPNSHLEIV